MPYELRVDFEPFTIGDGWGWASCAPFMHTHICMCACACMHMCDVHVHVHRTHVHVRTCAAAGGGPRADLSNLKIKFTHTPNTRTPLRTIVRVTRSHTDTRTTRRRRDRTTARAMANKSGDRTLGQRLHPGQIRSPGEYRRAQASGEHGWVENNHTLHRLLGDGEHLEAMRPARCRTSSRVS